MTERSLDFQPITGPGVDALDRREPEVLDAELAKTRMRAAGHRRKQIAILANAMNERGPEFTEYDMEQIGYAVFAAVGRAIVNGR